MIGIKEYNKKIGSLKNTRKMTKTMKMVSASKFKRAYKSQSNAQVYAQQLESLLRRLSGVDAELHPLMKVSPVVNKALVVLFSSDRGLCGGFNNNLIRQLRQWMQENKYKFMKVDLVCCGRRGYNAFRKSDQVKKYYENITLKPNFEDAMQLVTDLSKSFTSKEYDEVYLAYNQFKSPLSQVPMVERLFPLNLDAMGKQSPEEGCNGYILEPGPQTLFYSLISNFINFKVYFTLLENAAGEHGARMTAMDNAARNTAEMIDRYTLLRNRARQAMITTELIEIISGAEALK